MRKILTTLLLPVFALSALFAGMPMAGAANVLNSVTGTDNAVNATNVLTANVTLLNALALGDTVTITTRTQAGTPLALSAGALLINGQAETAVANGVGSVTVTLANALSAGVAFNIQGSGGAGLEITNPAASENITVIVTTSAGDIGAVTHAIAGADTVTVTALVESTLSMALSSNAINLGVIDTLNVVDSIADRTQQTDITVSTNAANGYVLNAEAGAFAGQPNRLIAFADQYANLAAGTEGFAIRVAATPATILTGAGNIGAGLATDDQLTPVTPKGLVSRLAGTNGDTTTIEYGAAVANTTPQGTYTETVTYSVTANF